ncbi:hypothetical protein L1887_08005 [Cichorium endivia]|nr:hypothetical protein L1887_08005 [Cichorium endivia]
MIFMPSVVVGDPIVYRRMVLYPYLSLSVSACTFSLCCIQSVSDGNTYIDTRPRLGILMVVDWHGHDGVANDGGAGDFTIQ